MRRFGVIPYMTPLQRATESSTMPKSVINTTVGGWPADGGCAMKRVAARNKQRRHKQNIPFKLPAGVDVIRIETKPPEKASSLLAAVSQLSSSQDSTADERKRCAILLPPASIIGTAIDHPEIIN